RFLNWRSYAILFGLLILGVSFYYINMITKEMEKAELAKVQVVVEGMRQINNAEPNTDISFATYIVSVNKTIPIIMVDEKENISLYINLNEARIAKDAAYLNNKLQEYKSHKQVIVSDFNYGKNYIYYGNSPMLEKLKYYPLLQMAVIFVFVLIVLIAV